MPFIAHNLKNVKKSLFFEPVEIKEDNNLLKVRLLDKKSVDFNAEYKMFFFHHGKEYNILAKPVDVIGNFALFQIKNYESDAMSEFTPIPVNKEVLLCDNESGVCIKAKCKELSLKGAKLLFEKGIDEKFFRLLSEKKFMELIFDTPKGKFHLYGTPVEVKFNEREIFLLFSHREENKNVNELYNILSGTEQNNGKVNLQ